MLIKAFLTAAQFEVVEANDGVEALEALRRASGVFDLLITDNKMPRMDGVELARRVSAAAPQIPVLFISGYAPAPEYPLQGSAVNWDFLAKPFTGNVLIERVSGLLDEGAPRTRNACS